MSEEGLHILQRLRESYMFWFAYSVAAASSSSSTATNSTAAGSAPTSAPANVVVAVPLEELTYDTQVGDKAIFKDALGRTGRIKKFFYLS